MKKKSLPLGRVYRLLEPGPVVLVSTLGARRPNIMTMSWHTMMEFEPPLVGCVISNRNYSFNIINETRECVINIPTVEIAKQVVGCGNCSGRRVDKFKKFGLTAADAAIVSAPMIDECYANLECTIFDDELVEKYNFFVFRVEKAWMDAARKDHRTIHHQGMGRFMVAGETISLPSRMK